MKKERFFLLGLILLLTGCSSSYNITLNKDGQINEKLVLNDAQIYCEDGTDYCPLDYTHDVSRYSDFGYIYNDNYEEKLESIEINYDKDRDYQTSLFANNYFKYGKIDIKKGIFELKVDHDTIKYLLDGHADLSKFKINVSLPYQVKSSNASSSKNNIYTWQYDSQINYEDYTLKINFDSSKLYHQSNMLWYLIISIVIVTIIFLTIYFKKRKKPIASSNNYYPDI